MKEMVKFGGSSLTSARQLKRAADTIKADKPRGYMIPSASSKRSDRDERVADMLYACYDAVAEGRSYKKILERIKNRYLDIIDGLNLNLNLDHEFERTEENFLAKAGRDYATSRGEYLSGIAAANYLGYEFIDTAEVILFDGNGNFEADLTNRKLSECLRHVGRTVIPGFYGFKHGGTVKIFSRGGSGVTGSTVAKAIHVDMYKNWTDISGVLMTDPRTMDDPEVIETVAYKELRKLSYMGASVLHEGAIPSIHKGGIPINIRNTNRPEDKGTLIAEDICHKPCHTMTGITGKKGSCSINIEKAMVSVEVGFGREVLSVFRQYDISFEHMPSGTNTMTAYVHQSEFEEYEQSVIAGTHKVVELDTAELESDLALIAAVGRGVRSNQGAAGRVFSAPAHVRVNIKMIDQGSSEWSTIIGVKNDDFEIATRTVYDIFVATEL